MGYRRAYARATWRFSPDPFAPVEIEGHWYFVKADTPRFMDRHQFAPIPWSNEPPPRPTQIGSLIEGSWWRGNTLGGMNGSAMIGLPRNYTDTYAGGAYFTLTPSAGVDPSEGIDQVSKWNMPPSFVLNDTAGMLVLYGARLVAFTHSDLTAYRLWTDPDGDGIWFEWKPLRTLDHFDNATILVHKGTAVAPLVPTSVFGAGFLTFWEELTGVLPIALNTGFVEWTH
jgi:hypothetical protein